MKRVLTMVAAVISLTACTQKSEINESIKTENMETKTELSNKEKAIAIIEAFETGDAAVLEFISDEKYIQHNLNFPDGKDVLKGFFQGKPTGFNVEIHRVFEEGDLVAMHSTYGGTWNNGTPQVAFDVFRFENGKMVEHWDNLLDIAEPNASGRTQVDGVKKVSDKDKTVPNKAIVQKLMDVAFLGGDFSVIPQLISKDKYLQHNPQASDGLEGFNEFVKYLTENNIEMRYNNVYQVIADGDFVLTLADGTFGGKEVAYYDLFRLEDGLIVEHWDVVTEIPAETEWQNQNGKFKKK